jgi:hypothetical protein
VIARQWNIRADRQTGLLAALLLVGVIVVASPLLRLIHPNSVEFAGASVKVWIPTDWATATIAATPQNGIARAWSSTALPDALPSDGGLPDVDLADGDVLVHYRFVASDQRGPDAIPEGATAEPVYLFGPYPVPILGVDARIVRQVPGPCEAVGGEVTLTADLPYQRSSAPESPPETLIGCFAGGDTAAAEARFADVVRTADDGTNERIVPTFFSALGIGIGIWVLGRRRDTRGTSPRA